MPVKKEDSGAAGADNLGPSGTDQFPTYQDEKGLTGADSGIRDEVKTSDPKEGLAPTVVIDHGEESPAAKKEREEMEKNPPSPTPVQYLPENQDESVKPQG